MGLGFRWTGPAKAPCWPVYRCPLTAATYYPPVVDEHFSRGSLRLGKPVGIYFCS